MKYNLNDLEYEKCLRYAYIDLLNYLDNKWKKAKNKDEIRASETLINIVVDAMDDILTK